jgi:tetratricopeptide (TPR) repeat protein
MRAATDQLAGARANTPFMYTQCQNLIKASERSVEEGQYGEAERYLLAAVMTAEDAKLEDLTLASALDRLSEIYFQQAKYDRAIPPCLRSLSIYQQLLPGQDDKFLASLNRLSRLYFYENRHVSGPRFWIRLIIELFFLPVLSVVPRLFDLLHSLALQYYYTFSLSCGIIEGLLRAGRITNEAAVPPIRFRTPSSI